MSEQLENFLGMWMDKNSNVLFIKRGTGDKVLVSFASGIGKAPVIRKFNRDQPTINVDGEYYHGVGELVVMFGAPYYGPQLNLLYKNSEIYEGKPSLEPSYVCSVSAPKKQKKWIKWFKPLEDFEQVEEDKREDLISSYQLMK